MVKLSTKARYALRAMMELAAHEGEGPMQLREIAAAQKISPKYLEQLAISLRTANLVLSERGPSGGYRLARLARDITALEVVQATEGPIGLLDCVNEATLCPRSSACAARGLWQKVSVAITEILSETTLADLATEQASVQQAAANCYVI
jgi:Rrf2 family protein